MDELRDYQHRKLDLADILRSSLNVARGSRDELIEGEIRSLLSRLAEDRFTLAVIGQFSRGKSTLMNAILGRAYLPTGVLPLTSVITSVRYGSETRASYLRRGSTMPISIGLEEIADLVSQSSQKRAELQVTRVDIELPAEILRLGVTFVDTPGIGSAIGVNSASTRQFLPDADAVVFVTAFDSALTSAEADLLRDLGRTGIRVFCVINKRDLVDERTSSEVAAFVQRAVTDSAREHDASVFPLSALNALSTKLRSDSSGVAESGLASLERRLEEFLTTGRATVFLGNLAARSAQLITRQRRDLRLGLLEADAPGRASEVAAAFQRTMAQVGREQRALVSEIRDRVAAALPARLGERSERWRQELYAQLVPLAEEIVASGGDESPEDARERIRYELQTSTERAVADWVARRCSEVTETITELASEQIGQLIELSRSPGRLGAELAGAALPQDAATDAGWTMSDVPLIAVPRVSWSLDLDSGVRPHLRRGAREGAFRQQLPSAFQRAVDDADRQVRQGFADLIDNWSRNLLSDIERRTKRIADRFTHQLESVPPADDLTILDELLTRLSSYQSMMSEEKPARHGRSGQTGQRRKPDRREPAPAEARSSETGSSGQSAREPENCVICRALTEGLFAYLSTRQLLLATREHDQARLAATNGFCPLHTWAYHATASPLGISAGYALLADTVAAQLDEAGERATDARELGLILNDLIVSHDACPVCDELASIESRAVLRHSTGPEDAPPPVLCAEHLVRVLEAGPSSERASILVHALAERLRRDAEDMRSYALKREALHRNLLTHEESRAHLETLRLLAGDPALARTSLEYKELSFGPG